MQYEVAFGTLPESRQRQGSARPSPCGSTFPPVCASFPGRAAFLMGGVVVVVVLVVGGGWRLYAPSRPGVAVGSRRAGRTTYNPPPFP